MKNLNGIALVILALVAGFLAYLNFKKAPEVVVEISSEQLADMVNAELKPYLDSLTSRKEAVTLSPAQVAELARLVSKTKGNGANSVAALQAAQKQFNEALSRFTYLQSSTELNDLPATVDESLEEDDGLTDFLDGVEDLAEETDAGPLTYSYQDEWAMVGMQIDPKDMRNGKFSGHLKNAYSISEVLDAKGTPSIVITNANPYTVTEGGTNHFVLSKDLVKSVQKQQGRFGLGFQAGGFVDKDLKVRPGLGLGLSYQVVRF